MARKRPVKVLIVDANTPFAKAVSAGIGSSSDVDIVGIASDAWEAREMIVAKEPDVLLMDVSLPRMDGAVFLQKLMPQWPVPVVLMTDPKYTSQDLLRRAQSSGALEHVKKVPSGSKDFASFLIELRPKLKIASSTDVTHWKLKPRRSRLTVEPIRPARVNRLIAIGASTGGTEAIARVVTRLPSDAPGVVIVQHMPHEFTGAFAQRLNRDCKMVVKEAEHGDLIIPGRILIAAGDRQMRIKRHGQGLKVTVMNEPKVCGHRPSVEVMFRSIAGVAGPITVGVMLTGMGDDGASGMALLRQSGARTIAQDEATSVVFGMPKMAIERGGVEYVRPLDDIASMIMRLAAQKTQNGRQCAS